MGDSAQLDRASDFGGKVHSRQFICGPWRATARNLLCSASPGGGFVVSTHAALQVSSARRQARELLCLGSVLDPAEFSLQDHEILEAILRRMASFADFERLTAGLGGRWLMFVRIGAHLRLYPDAACTKSAFYTKLPSGELWIASQPALLAEAIGVRTDETMKARFDGHQHNATSWPGTQTPFEGVRQLLPNHYLDLVTGCVHRFWPVADVEPVATDDAASEIARLLRGTIAAVLHRGDTALPVTAGYDSRTLLACAGPRRRELNCFTIAGHHSAYADRSIPRRLARRLGFELQVLRPQRYPEAFWQVLQQNVAGMWWDPGDYMVFTFSLLNTRFALLGLLSEIARCFYYRSGTAPAELTAETLARLAHYGDHPLAIRAFGEWLDDVPSFSALNLLDLFYWEHRAGNWAAMTCTAFDTVFEPIAPYNCRRLLERALGAPLEARTQPYLLHRRVCELAEPAISDVPFNYSVRDAMMEPLMRAVPWRLRHRLQRARMRWAGFARDR